ncbi:MAG: type I DNA topoisomerase [Candidatus Pacebacteria bacterium]|nr:type I DNA topoisomerase [Candidatus Paceibacterota bacterium]
MKVVVVESPAKAKTINKYLGKNYIVLASYGHVRDLPPHDGSVRPDENFAMDWEMESRGLQRVSEIAKAVKGADELILATDPDREGEAISWHVLEALKEKKTLLKSVAVSRVVFNEVTKAAVDKAFANPRQINQELVDAYLARRALDYLVGFTLSPILWRKLPGSKSAGRVQSVALRLICDREDEIESFKTTEYWTVGVELATLRKEKFTARLTQLGGQKLDKFSLKTAAEAEAAKIAIEAQTYSVAAVEPKQTKKNPYPPFMTSTLQQEASRKLGYTASRTMQIAQKLYEGIELSGETVGLITYMRTDGLYMAPEAIEQARQTIVTEFGREYLPASPRLYKSKQKNAQEAHEAIRPTDFSKKPEMVAKYLSQEQARLYELIWKRSLACQMESAILDQVAVDIDSKDGLIRLRANGSVVKFAGFMAVYREDSDDQAGSKNNSASDGDSDDDQGRILPAMAKGEAIERKLVTPEQHFTQPPPRFTEASLVKQMEELGIGRPSTYASIIDVLQNRNYVRLDNKRFIPEDRGRVVTVFLTEYFGKYIDSGFTAGLEEELDDVSGGRLDWHEVLRKFWNDFSVQIGETKNLTITQVIDRLDEVLAPHFFPAREDGTDARLCPSCKAGRLGLKLGKTGGFIGCSTYPECRYTRAFSDHSDDGEPGSAGGVFEPKNLGSDPKTGMEVTLRKGPFGIYVQLGEGDKTNKPKRASLLKTQEPGQIDLVAALNLLALPREIGKHPETGEMILAGLGRFGPYLKHGSSYTSLPAGEDLMTIGMNRAVDILAQPKTGRAKAVALRQLGPHPSDQKPVEVFNGRYGPYIAWNKVFATLPKSVSPEEVTIEEALPLLEAKLAAGGGGKSKFSGRKSTKTSPVKKTAAKGTKLGQKASAAKKASTKKVAGVVE